MFQISDLCGLADNYLEPDQVREIYRAYQFGAEAHEGQRRASGEPYIQHPIQVAKILAEMRLDYQSIVAAILHDVIEDTDTAKPQIAKQFGKEVADLVDGVSKLTQISFDSRAEAQAEYFRKMIMAMARDIRVILVKLADRLHNMHTLSALPLEKRRRIAHETLGSIRTDCPAAGAQQHTSRARRSRLQRPVSDALPGTRFRGKESTRTPQASYQKD